MQQEPLNLVEFQRKPATEEACVEHVFKLRWPGDYHCPRCGHGSYCFHSTRGLYRCSKCKYQVRDRRADFPQDADAFGVQHFFGNGPLQAGLKIGWETGGFHYSCVDVWMRMRDRTMVRSRKNLPVAEKL